MSVTSNLQTAYEQQYSAEQGDWRKVGAKQKALNIVELTGGMNPVRILEVGAGDGSILWWLSQMNFAPEFYAVEIAQSALQLIEQKDIPQVKQAVVFDGYSIPFPDNFFDLVILSHVLEHVEFERRLLRELRRVSVCCLIEVPKDYRSNVDAKVAHFLSYGHINVYTPSSLRFLLRTEGFQIRKQKIGVYSRDTYRLMYKTGIKSTLLYLFKKIMVSLPVTFLRDYFANTITVLVMKEEKDLKIF